MSKRSIVILLMAAAFLISPGPAANSAGAGTTDPTAEIVQFNRDYEAAHQRMDTPAILATWADDGVSLLPDTGPIVGKAAITKFIDKAIQNLVGFKMLKAEIHFRDIRVSGDWASEWAIEHQLLQPPGDKPVIDHYGKILLILRRTPNGWRVQTEMWNSTPKPD